MWNAIARRMAPLRRILVGVVLGVPLSALLLWLAVRNADFDDVRMVVSDVDVANLSLAVVVMAFVYGGQALRWWGIARAPMLAPAWFGRTVACSAAVNNVLPGRIGDLLRARWLQVDAGISGGRALATVFIDRACDVIVLVALLLFSLPFVAEADWLRPLAAGGVVLVIGIAAMLLGARAYTRRVGDRVRPVGLVRRVTRDTLFGLSEPLGERRVAALGAVSLVVWLLCSFAVWIVARGVGIELSPVDAVFVAAVLNLGVAIPSAPGFVGTYQWLGVSSLALVGVGTDAALAFAILMHAVWYVPTTLVGGAFLVRRLAGSIFAVPRAAATHEASDG